MLTLTVFLASADSNAMTGQCMHLVRAEAPSKSPAVRLTGCRTTASGSVRLTPPTSSLFKEECTRHVAI